MIRQGLSLSITAENVLKKRKRRSHIIRKKRIKKQRKPRKVWLIKPFTKIKPSGKIFKRKKGRIEYDIEEA